MKTRAWLSSHNALFATQARAGRPCTHTLLDGGVVVLRDAASYRGMYERLATDIVQHAGKVSLCENFPRIYGSWQAETADGLRRRPPPELVLRARRAMGFKAPRPADGRDGEERMFSETEGRTRPGYVEWRETIFALDMDYGATTTTGYNVDDILDDIRVAQRVMIECGARPIATRCYICIADTAGTLGVHAYFPFSAYFPEECMELATIIVGRLQEERPLHLGNGRFWHQILDVGIYNGSLRLIGVQKARPCETCQNKAGARKSCGECSGSGVLHKDRRYWPRLYLDEHGRHNLAETRWMAPMCDYIHAKCPPPPAPATAAAAVRQTAERQLKPFVAPPGVVPLVIGDDTRCAEFCTAFLLICSLRLVTSAEHTAFTPPHDSPRPNFPRSWVTFFQSVLDAANNKSSQSNRPATLTRSLSSQSMARPATLVEALTGERHEDDEPALPVTVETDEKRAPPHAVEATDEELILGPWTSPAGETMSMSAKEDVPSWKQRDHDRALRERFEHLLISPHDDVDEARKMATGSFSEFRKAETLSNDAEGRCKYLQEYIRGWTHPAYVKLQVVRINHSMGFGNTLAHVRGPGQHFCQIAARQHGKNTIFFMVKRRSGELTQHCFHKDCAGRHYNWGVIGHDDVRVLFSPLELLQKKADELTPEQKGWANKLIHESKALSAKVARSNKPWHKSKVAPPVAMPSTPLGRAPTTPMAAALGRWKTSISYEDVALGDHDDDVAPPPPPGIQTTRPPSPSDLTRPFAGDFVAPLAPDPDDDDHNDGPTRRDGDDRPKGGRFSEAQLEDIKTKSRRRPRITPLPAVDDSLTSPPAVAVAVGAPAPSPHPTRPPVPTFASAKVSGDAKTRSALDGDDRRAADAASRRPEDGKRRVSSKRDEKRRRLSDAPLPRHVLSMQEIQRPPPSSLSLPPSRPPSHRPQPKSRP